MRSALASLVFAAERLPVHNSLFHPIFFCLTLHADKAVSMYFKEEQVRSHSNFDAESSGAFQTKQLGSSWCRTLPIVGKLARDENYTDGQVTDEILLQEAQEEKLICTESLRKLRFC